MQENKFTKMNNLLIFFKRQMNELPEDSFVEYRSLDESKKTEFIHNVFKVYAEMQSLVLGTTLSLHKNMDDAIEDYRMFSLKSMEDTIKAYRVREKEILEKRKELKNE